MGKKTTQTQSAKSGNYAYDALSSSFKPTITQGLDAGSTFSALLGLGGDTAAANAAFDKFLGSSGYQFALNEANRNVLGTAAGRGLLNSGATARALSQVGQQTGLSYFNDYLTKLLQQQSAGLAAGGLTAQAGQYSESQGKSESGGGIGSILGPVLALAAAIPTGGTSLGALAGAGGALSALSDPRLKKDVTLIGYREDGLGLYSYTYIWEDTPRVGVMADEVEKLRPEALGPTIAGFKTVDYGKLGE